MPQRKVLVSVLQWLIVLFSSSVWYRKLKWQDKTIKYMCGNTTLSLLHKWLKTTDYLYYNPHKIPIRTGQIVIVRLALYMPVSCF